MATGKQLKTAILARRATKGPRKKRTLPAPSVISFGLPMPQPHPTSFPSHGGAAIAKARSGNRNVLNRPGPFWHKCGRGQAADRDVS
jgi:hypothetical protein